MPQPKWKKAGLPQRHRVRRDFLFQTFPSASSACELSETFSFGVVQAAKILNDSITELTEGLF
jgi:hypothetical protein